MLLFYRPPHVWWSHITLLKCKHQLIVCLLYTQYWLEEGRGSPNLRVSHKQGICWFKLAQLGTFTLQKSVWMNNFIHTFFLSYFSVDKKSSHTFNRGNYSHVLIWICRSSHTEDIFKCNRIWFGKHTHTQCFNQDIFVTSHNNLISVRWRDLLLRA